MLLIKISYYYQLLEAMIRLSASRCPMCNSDSPGVYHCPICDGYSRMDSGIPTKETLDSWRNNYKGVLRAQMMLKKFLHVRKKQKA